MRAVSAFSAFRLILSGCWAPPGLSLVTNPIFMDKISRRSWGEESVQCGDLRIASLLFADDVVLLASTHCDFQQALGQFAAECEADESQHLQI